MHPLPRKIEHKTLKLFFFFFFFLKSRPSNHLNICHLTIAYSQTRFGMEKKLRWMLKCLFCDEIVISFKLSFFFSFKKKIVVILIRNVKKGHIKIYRITVRLSIMILVFDWILDFEIFIFIYG